MPQIVAGYDLFPTGTEVDMDAIANAIPGVLPKGVSITESSIEPVAFGLMKVSVGFLIDDSDENVGTKIEEGLRSIANVENIECVSMTNI
ncbi:MAG: translation elongation factor EF-1beta [Candidatus Methanomethylophilaceae archaeon]|nr:elongation factor 1-beta [Candidatus Methanomethylophilaceae archaeon]